LVCSRKVGDFYVRQAIIVPVWNIASDDAGLNGVAEDLEEEGFYAAAGAGLGVL
jgi:hypothetical protein